MKRIFKLFFMTVLALVCATLLVGCGEADGVRIMNVSLNPEVEFILDANNKVVSVNALNEEGNLIISAEAFVGKSAEDAARLFVEVSKETGFIVSGVSGDVEISFSGDATEAEALFNSVKAKVEEYLNANNLTAYIEKAEAITKAELEELYAEAAPYLEEAEIRAMEYAELVRELANERRETAEFYSQELKRAYYEAKAAAMEGAKLEAVKVAAGIDSLTALAFDAAYGAYSVAADALEDARNSLLVDENGIYQRALAAFRAAKVEYLNYRAYVASLDESAITSAISAQLESLESVLDNAESALISAGESANNTISGLKAQLKSAYDAVTACIENFSAKATQYAGEIAAKREAAQNAFFTEFESGYASAITTAKNEWNAMKAALLAGYSAD